ncbi:MAG: hypothetical protein CO016_04155 [Candidatus Yonathbacteria bacterium CG_4_8_14_3_um_filter_46_25]|nr:MAG: hypothetical protein CO016_04155 [Candidatus Yonathbacteria bacterium CG_4_8_14_3_um_filter_46_25]
MSVLTEMRKETKPECYLIKLTVHHILLNGSCGILKNVVSNIFNIKKQITRKHIMKRSIQEWLAVVIAVIITIIALSSVAQAVDFYRGNVENDSTSTSVSQPTNKRIVPKPPKVVATTTLITLEKDMPIRAPGARDGDEDCIEDSTEETDCEGVLRTTIASSTARERIQAQREATLQKLEEQKQAREEKMDERAKKISELRNERIRAYMQRMLARFNAAIQRLSAIADRIDSRIEKLSAQGVNTFEARNSISVAREKILIAEQDTSAAKQKSEEALLSEDPKTSFDEVRAIVNDVVATIKDAHVLLVDAITLLKNSTKDKTSGETNTTTEAE